MDGLTISENFDEDLIVRRRENLVQDESRSCEGRRKREVSIVFAFTTF